MTTRLSETQIHEWLDTNGYLSQSHNEGCYAIELHVPENAERAWQAVKDVSPPEPGFFQAVEEQGLVYVGASQRSVYGRLLDHGRGSVRQPSIIQVYPPVRMYGVAFDTREFTYALRVREFNYALQVRAESGSVVWSDGECYF